MKIYIVAIVSVDTYWIKHVCLSEETARKRFEEEKSVLIQDAKEGLEMTKKRICIWRNNQEHV